MSYGFKAVQFLDDAFTSNLERLKEICALLKPLELKWRCYSRAGIEHSLLERMQEAGCTDIGFGAESGSQTILDRVQKGTTVNENTKFVKDCKELGMSVQAFIVVGLPGETQTTIQDTIEWFESALPNKFGLNILVPVPGSPIVESPGKHGITLRDISPEQWAAKQLDPMSVRSAVATKDMSFSEIESAYLMMMQRFTKLTGFVPGVTHG